MRDWYERYEPRGFTIVGVHTPEFFWERPADKVRAAMDKQGIRYPVVLDNDHRIWDRWGVRAWPTQVLVDRKGVVRFRHIGEGAYAETEAMIRRLLDEQG